MAARRHEPKFHRYARGRATLLLRTAQGINTGGQIPLLKLSVVPSGFTIEEMTRGRLGTLSPSERK